MRHEEITLNMQIIVLITGDYCCRKVFEKQLRRAHAWRFSWKTFTEEIIQGRICLFLLSTLTDHETPHSERVLKILRSDNKGCTIKQPITIRNIHPSVRYNDHIRTK